MTGFYRCFNLCIHSDLPLEGFPDDGEATPDISVRLGRDAREQLRNTSPPPMQIRPASDGGWLFHVPELADFWIRDAKRIEVSPTEQAEPDQIRLYLMGSALGMALHLRGDLALHAATAAHHGAAIAFVGAQQAGKSTLAMTLAQRGAEVMGDDTMVIWPSPSGPRVWPGPLRFKLWSDTIATLKLRPGVQISDRLDKHYVPNPAIAPDRPLPMRAVVALEMGAPDQRVTLHRLSGLEGLRTLAEHTYRPEYIPLLGRQEAHFRQCAELAAQIPVWRLSRPQDLSRAGDTADALLKAWPRLITAV